MKVKKISATELKNNPAEVLNRVHYNNEEFIVEKHGEPYARIVPVTKKVQEPEVKYTSLAEKRKKLMKYFQGAIPDFPDVTQDRRSRKTSIKL